MSLYTGSKRERELHIEKTARVEAKAAINLYAINTDRQTAERSRSCEGSERARMSLSFEQGGVPKTYVIRHDVTFFNQ